MVVCVCVCVCVVFISKVKTACISEWNGVEWTDGLASLGAGKQAGNAMGFCFQVYYLLLGLFLFLLFFVFLRSSFWLGCSSVSSAFLAATLSPSSLPPSPSLSLSRVCSPSLPLVFLFFLW